jgi:hypothetical protein
MRKNLIYMSVFKEPEYVKLICLLIKSLAEFGNVNMFTTDILIYTSQDFVDLICQRLKEINFPPHVKLPIFFKIFEKDHIVEIFQVCCMRLQIFNNDFIHNYDKILYLDNDVLINSDVNVLFNQEIDDDKLYGIEDGTIGHFFWGSNFFDFDSGEFSREQKGFSSGILLFKNSESMRQLYEDINNHVWYLINNEQHNILFYDQPIINYNAIKKGKYDNTWLMKYAKNSPLEREDEKIIYHFPGTVGETVLKYDRMEKFYERIKNKLP